MTDVPAIDIKEVIIAEQNNKRIANYVFGRSNDNFGNNGAAIARILVASFLILEEMKDGKRKDKFGQELAAAIKNFGGAKLIEEHYQSLHNQDVAITLFKDVTDIANDKWQDPGKFSQYVTSFFLSLSQGVACGVAIGDHLQRNGHTVLSKVLAPFNATVNLYFIQKSMPDIISKMAYDITQSLKNKDELERSQILKSAGVEFFKFLSAIAASAVDASFVVSSAKSFHSDVVYKTVLTASVVAMTLIYRDSLSSLIDNIPLSREESKKLMQDMGSYYNELADPIKRASGIWDKLKSAVPGFADAATATIALSKAGAFTYGTYDNYKDSGEGAAITLTALSALPAACLTINSLFATKKYLLDRLLTPKPQEFARHYDDEKLEIVPTLSNLGTIPMTTGMPPIISSNTSDSSDGKLGVVAESLPSDVEATQQLSPANAMQIAEYGQQANEGISSHNIALNTICVFCLGLSALGNATLVELGAWFVLCAWLVSAATTGRAFIAKFKTTEEINIQERFVKSLMGPLAEGFIERVEQFQLDTSAKNDGNPSTKSIQPNGAMRYIDNELTI